MSRNSRRKAKMANRKNRTDDSKTGDRNVSPAFSTTPSTELAEKLALAGIKVENQTDIPDEEFELPPLEVESEPDPTIPEEEPEDPEYAKKMEELELARAAAEAAEAEVKAKTKIIPPPRQEKKAPKPQTQPSAPPKKPATPAAVAEQTGPGQLFGVMGVAFYKDGRPSYASVAFLDENGNPQEWNYPADDWYDGFVVKPGSPVSFRLKKNGGRYTITNVEYSTNAVGLEGIVNRATAALDGEVEAFGNCEIFTTGRLSALIFGAALEHTDAFKQLPGRDILNKILNERGYMYVGPLSGRQDDRHILVKETK